MIHQFPASADRARPVPPVASPAALAATLETTLLFEQLVDVVIAFQRRTGALTESEARSLVCRGFVRAGVVQLLNELDPHRRIGAELRCAEFLGRALPIRAIDGDTLAALVADGVEQYRRHLQQLPLPGVGTLV